MTNYILKNLCIFICCVYTYLKITNIRTLSTVSKFFMLLLSCLLTIISCFFNIYLSELTYIAPLLLLWIIMTFFNNNPKTSFTATSISFGISYCLLALSSLFITVILTPILNIETSTIHTILAITILIIQPLLTIGLFKIKRFRNGMPFLNSYAFNNFAFFICLFIITLSIYTASSWPNYEIQALLPLVFAFSLAFLIHWWQSQITKSYKRSLQLRELESLRMELAEKEKQVVELSRQNQELGRLIHKDNKLIPAMEHAVHEYFITDFATLDDAKNRAQTLLLEIEALSKNRSNIILEMNISKSKHYSTGVPSLDTLLNYMDKRARQEHINLSVHMSIDLNTYIPKAITSEDLVHVLSDLLENAIIASKDRADANIQLQFYESEKHFIIEIGDNGIPFEITSLVNFGLTQFTTHEDTGGSGIGLMDIWKIKEKYSASLHITEYEDNAPFTKKIALIFNKKNRYSISTNRKEDILQQSKRIDLQVF